MSTALQWVIVGLILAVAVIAFARSVIFNKNKRKGCCGCPSADLCDKTDKTLKDCRENGQKPTQRP